MKNIIFILAVLNIVSTTYANTGWGTHSASAQLQIKVVVPSYCYLKTAENVDENIISLGKPVYFVCNLKEGLTYLTITESSQGYLSWNSDCTDGHVTLKAPFQGEKHLAYVCNTTADEKNLISITHL